MAKYSSAACAFFEANGSNILPVLQTVTDKVTPNLDDTTVLGDSWGEQGYVGIKKFDLTLMGFYADDAGLVDAAVRAAGIGNAQLITFAPFGNLLGSNVTIYAAPLVGPYERAAQINKFTKAGITYQGNGQVYPAKLVLPRQTAAAAFNTAGGPLDNGASSANGAVGVLQVESVSLGGYTSWSVKLRHSADNVTYVDLATFPIVTTAPLAFLVSANGTINRYVDVDVSLQGSGSAPSITASVALARL